MLKISRYTYNVHHLSLHQLALKPSKALKVELSLTGMSVLQISHKTKSQADQNFELFRDKKQVRISDVIRTMDDSIK